MNDENQPSRGDELPPVEWLEEWTVPELPADLSHRVMQRMHDNPSLSPPSFASSRSSTMIATGTAVFAAAAAAAALVISVSRPGTPPAEPVAPPPAPTGLVVAGDAELHALGNLVLDVAPGDAEVEIDGASIAGPSPFVATNLPAGRHEIRVHREGYQPWIKVIDVPAAELQLPITLVNEKPSAQPSSDAQPKSHTPTTGVEIPHARAAQAEVSGTLDKNIVRRVVRAHINEVRQCYNQGLIRDHKLQGKVVAAFTIASDGTVASSAITSSTLTDDEVGSCIAAQIRAWKFPKPEGGTVNVTYPFELSTE